MRPFSPRGKKVLGVIGWMTAGLLGVLLLAALTIPLWIGPIGCRMINRSVPEQTGTAFRLESFALNPYTGRARLSGLRLGNPREFWDPRLRRQSVLGMVSDSIFAPEKDALTVESIEVDMQTLSLLTDTYVINEIVVREPVIHLDTSLAGGLPGANFRRIIEHVRAYQERARARGESEANRRFAVGKVTITGAQVKVRQLPRPYRLQSDITIAGIGTKDAPVTEDELLDRIWQGALKSVLDELKGRMALT